MNPIYKFELTVNGVAQGAFPVYSNDMAISYEQENNQVFFRRKLSGELTFQKTDYVRIVTASFDTEFGLEIFISYDAGITWASFWKGTFWKTDCKFDDDAETVVVRPNAKDDYEAVLAGLDKEYDIIPLAPEIVPIKADKRPMIQVYLPGQTVIGCFLSGMWWEQECQAVALSEISNYHFSFNRGYHRFKFSGDMVPALPESVFHEHTERSQIVRFDFVEGNFRYRRWLVQQLDRITIYDVNSGMALWSADIPISIEAQVDYEIRLLPTQYGQGLVTMSVSSRAVYARYVTDVESAIGTDTYPIPDNDIVPNNRNYSRVVGYNFPNTIGFSLNYSSTPTQWGLYEDGKYYDVPSAWLVPEWFPIARLAWEEISMWFTFSPFDWITEKAWRKEFVLKDAYPLDSVISVLLSQIAPGITHEGTTEYSQFLYGVNPITNIEQRIFITPKSNVISSGYDQPAQKAVVSLGAIMQMLRDCYRCYWYIEDGKFKIEHIRFFNNGGAYYGSPGVGIDLTAQEVTRNGKKWAFATSKYSFEKPNMAARYQFEWMDDVTQLFEGYPIDILSGYVNPENVENISIANFTSDVDYVLLNPTEVSKDGFVLLSAELTDGEYKLPYLTIGAVGNRKVLQNGYAAFVYLQQYYFWDMPAWNFKINGETQSARGIKKLKTQSLKFPCLQEPNLMKLVKTNLGNGMIKNLSLNLSSRNAEATLKYDTE